MTAHADIRQTLRPAWLCLLLALLASVAAAQEAVQPPPAAAPVYRYWTTDWSFQDVDVRQLTERLESIGIVLPVEASGDVSVRFRVAIPLNGLRQPQAYRFEGSLSSNQLQLDQLHLSDLRAAVRYDNGVLQLQSLQTQWQRDDALDSDDVMDGDNPQPQAGQVSGSARAELVPRGELSADLQLQRTQVDPLVQLLQRVGVVSPQTRIAGQLTGRAKLRCQIAGLQQPENWQFDAQVSSPNFQLNDSPLLTFDSGPVNQSDGRFSMPGLNIQYVDNPAIQLAGSLAHQWGGRQPFELGLQANNVPAEEVAAMLGQSSSLVSGKVDLRIDASGQQQPPQWNIVAQLGSPGLSVGGVDLGLIEHELRCDPSTLRLQPIRGSEAMPSQGTPAMRIGSVSADYRLQPMAFELSELHAELFGGQVDGRLTLARGQPDPQAEHSIDLRWDQIRIPVSLPVFGLVDSRLAADVSGTIAWRVPAIDWQQPLKHRGTASLTLHRLQVADVDVGNAELQLAADGQAIDLAGSGQCFGGSFRVSAVSSLADQTTWRDVWQDAWQADINLQAADLSNLSRVMRSRVLDRIDGKLSATVAIRRGQLLEGETEGGELRFDAQVQLQNVVYQDRQLTQRLRLDLRGDEQSVWLDRVEGRYAGGTLSGSGGWSLGSGQRQIALRATAIDLSAAVPPFAPQAAGRVDGYVSATATITKTDAYQVKGAIQWHDGRLIEIPVKSGNTGFHARLSDSFRSWQADFNRIELRTGRGQWTGDLHMASTTDRRGLKMASQWKLHRVDFTDLFPSSGGPVSLGATRASGNLTLGGRAIRSVQDLQGRFDVELDGTEARAVPGLPRTQNYLGAVSLGAIRFDEGRMRGRVGGGAVALHEFWLLDEQLRVYADGSVRLADGRMNMNAVLNTGDFSAQNLLLRQLATTAGAGAAPLSVLIQANQLLSNRTLILDLTGPVGNPRVRLKTVDTLRANATEFFLQQARRAAGAAVLGAVLSD